MLVSQYLAILGEELNFELKQGDTNISKSLKKQTIIKGNSMFVGRYI